MTFLRPFFTFRHPLGPWTATGRLLTPDGPVTRAQQRAVFTVPAPGNVTRYIHLGNQWVPGAGGEGTCSNAGLFYWWPLGFDTDGNIEPITKFSSEASFTIEV